MIDILLKYILWYEFLNDLDAQSDFDKSRSSRTIIKYAVEIVDNWIISKAPLWIFILVRMKYIYKKKLSPKIANLATLLMLKPHSGYLP